MLRSHYCFCIFCAILGAVLAVLLLAPPKTTAQGAKGPVSFIKDVAPILKENCFSCHNAKQRKGGFDMTTFETLRTGGKEGASIVDGKPDQSLICKRITTSGKKRMPPPENGIEALPEAKAAIIEQWVKEGAKLDAGIDAKADLYRELRVRWMPPTPPASYKFPVTVTALAFTPDSKQLVVGGQHELTVWDPAEGKLLKRIYTRAERAKAMVFLPDGKLAVAGGRPGQEGDVRIYDLVGGQAKEENGVAILDGVNDKGVMITQLLDTDDEVLCLAVSADGNKLAAGGCDRLVRVWDMSGGYAAAKLEQTIENHADWVFGVALAPDGKHLLTCSRDKTAKVWDLEKKESVLTFPDHQAGVFGVAVRPDGKVGFSVGEDKNLRVWNSVGDGKQVRASSGHTQAVLKLAYLPEKGVLVTCGADNTVRTWNGNDGTPGKALTGHTDQVFAVAISPDANLIASGSYNGEVRIWKVADGSLVKAFNASPGLPQPTTPEPKK
jgi:WD40 repeat protein